MANENEKIIKDAQYRKGLSIAFFNATNAAVEIIKLEGLKTDMFKKPKKGKGKTKAKKTIINPLEVRLQLWRNWLLKEHQEYYMNVIAQVGVNYSTEDAIAKLKATKTMDELKSTWIALSADERKDTEIKKVALELKASLVPRSIADS